MSGYITIKKYGKYEYEDRKSVFIGEAMPVSTEAEALSFIEQVKKKYSDARHHVYAYVLRENSIMRFTDDHEPQGTAGMPVLDSIRKNGCTDTVVVVTRYFGGTLLGTGGLVKAYTSAAVGAIKQSEIIEYAVYSELSIDVSYSDYGKLATLLEASGFRISDTVYADGVTVLGKLKKTELEHFIKNVTEASSGRAEIKVLSEKFDY